MGKHILVCGAGGFIAGHLVKQLSDQGHLVRAVDIKPLEQWYQVHDNIENIGDRDLREKYNAYAAVDGVSEVYNLACNMGGMGFIQNNHTECMLSVLINTHILMACKEYNVRKYLYSSSACVYPEYAQNTIKSSDDQALKESDAYPAQPEDGYGWEKLFSEILAHYFHQDFGVEPRVCRYHNVYGPYGTWDGGREKAPAALCRKVIKAKLSGDHNIDIWGDGEQTRSFMYVDDCLTGMEKIMESDYTKPLNLGSDEMVSINGLVDIIEDIADVKMKRNYLLDKPQGVRGRNSDNTLIKEKLDWVPSISLRDGLEKTYAWIYDQIVGNKKDASEDY